MTTSSQWTVPVGYQYCSYHDVDEPGKGAYIICPECNHVYVSAKALQDAYAAQLPEQPPPANEIYFCPLCASDF